MDIQTLTAQSILEEETMLEIFDEPTEAGRERLIIALTDKAKLLGVATRFKQLLNAYKRDFKALNANNKKRASNSFENTLNFDFPEWDENNEYKCGDWIADGDGIRVITMFGETWACMHPIYISRKLVNLETGLEKVELTYFKRTRNGNSWKTAIVSKGIIASATKIVQLAETGIAVTSENARPLVRYLSDIENYNADIIPVVKSTSKMGWLEDGLFMPYENDIIYDSEDQFKDIVNSITEKGNYNTWLNLVKDLRKKGRYEVNLYLAGAFASVLLKPLNLLPFILNLWGESGQGKTVALMVACSIWANPAENKYMTDLSSTKNAFERTCDVLNNLPLLIDDLSKITESNKMSLTDIVYYLCNGKGRSRSNIKLGLERVANWNNATLTNMERPLTSETMRGGAVNRILDFEMMDGNIFENGNKVVNLVCNNYGFAGQEFIKVVQELGFDELKKIQENWLDIIRNAGDDKEEKQMIPLSVLLTADQIAEEYIFKDGIQLDFTTCFNQLKSKDDVSEYSRAYEFILSEISTNRNMFSDNFLNPITYGQVWGSFDSYNGEQYCCIHTNKFREMCDKGNISAKGFAKWLDKNDLLHKNNSSKSGDFIFRKREGGQMTSFYSIRLQEEWQNVDFSAINMPIVETPF